MALLALHPTTPISVSHLRATVANEGSKRAAAGRNQNYSSRPAPYLGSHDPAGEAVTGAHRLALSRHEASVG